MAFYSTKLKEMLIDNSDQYCSYCLVRRTYFHIRWACLRIKQFLCQLCRVLSKILTCEIKCMPMLALLSQMEKSLEKKYGHFMKNLIEVTRKEEEAWLNCHSLYKYGLYQVKPKAVTKLAVLKCI